jgi:hypothetical protein
MRLRRFQFAPNCADCSVKDVLDVIFFDFPFKRLPDENSQILFSEPPPANSLPGNAAFVAKRLRFLIGSGGRNDFVVLSHFTVKV